MLQEIMIQARNQYSKDLMKVHAQLGIARAQLEQALSLLPFGSAHTKVLEAINDIAQVMDENRKNINQL